MSHYFENDRNLKSEFRSISYKYDSFSFEFLSDNGVFSKDKIDYGSKALLESYLKDTKVSEKVLDVGCGYGFIGIVISKINNSYVDMIDVNKRALHLTKKNIDKYDVNAKAFVSDAYENVSGVYDTIITNPPIRAGKSKVIEILSGAYDYLKDDGKLFFVIRKDQGALSIKKILEEKYFIELIDRDKGFYIFKGVKKNG